MINNNNNVNNLTEELVVNDKMLNLTKWLISVTINNIYKYKNTILKISNILNFFVI